MNMKLEYYKTGEHLYNEGPRYPQNMFAITRFVILRFLSIYFAFAGAKKVVCYAEDIAIKRFI